MTEEVKISKAQLTAWAESLIHMNHHGTLVQREIEAGNRERALDLSESWLFAAHMAFGLSVAGLLCEQFRFEVFSIYNARQGVAAVLALSVFGLSDFLWGGAIFGSGYLLPLLFLLLGAGAFACVYFFGQRAKR